MNGNPMDDQVVQDVLNEVNTFTGSMNQSRIEFVNLFSVAMRKLVEDYKNRGLMIQDQQKTIEKLKEHITTLEKELNVLRREPMKESPSKE